MKLLKIEPKLKPPFLEAIEDHESFFIIRLQGDIETSALGQWHGKMSEIIDQTKIYARPIICDFGKVKDCDTATVAALIKRFSEFRKEGTGKLVFFNIQGELQSIFEITRLDQLFTVRKTQEEAVAALADFEKVKKV